MHQVIKMHYGSINILFSYEGKFTERWSKFYYIWIFTPNVDAQTDSNHANSWIWLAEVNSRLIKYISFRTNLRNIWIGMHSGCGFISYCILYFFWSRITLPVFRPEADSCPVPVFCFKPELKFLHKKWIPKLAKLRIPDCTLIFF